MSLLVANWKLNNLWEDCDRFSAALRELCPDHFGDNPQLPELVVCPAHPYLSHLGRLLADSQIFLGAQNVSAVDSGAYTGEVSARMLADCGCDYCIIGHSERRSGFNETAEQLSDKLALLRASELIPIYCVGESQLQRAAGQAEGHTLGQLEAVRERLASFEPGGFVVAYEPLWAIGTGQNAEPSEAAEMARAIRSWLAGSIGQAHADATQLLYGGSVKADNIAGYMAKGAFTGALVGGASLKAESFAALAHAIAED